MQTNPPELEAAIAKHRQGLLDEAVPVYKALSEARPDLAEPWHLLGVVEMQKGTPEAAVPFFRAALDRDGAHLKCLSNLGGALCQLKRYAEAEEVLTQTVELEPAHVEALYNLGTTLLVTGKPEAAAARFRAILALTPNHVKASNNLSVALRHLQRHDEAMRVLQTAIDLTPGQNLLLDSLISLLNHHTPTPEQDENLAALQARLKDLYIASADGSPIREDAVRDLYRQAQAPIIQLADTIGLRSIHMWRGRATDPGCDRHKIVFDQLGVIPETCFGCYKVEVRVSSIRDHLKLMVAFETLALPNDNTRKCFVETRKGASGTYKGLIYCESLDEAKALVELVGDVLNAKLPHSAQVAIKRGCTEFALAFPEYDRIGDDDGTPMAYNEAWRALEDKADRELVDYQYPMPINSYNHPHVTLKDALIMRAWMAYAASIGDDSYLSITGEPVPPMAPPE